MGVILDSILVYKDNITGGAFEALSVASGDSLTLRWFGDGTKPTLYDSWGGNNAHLCEFQVRSPLLHDDVHGIRWQYQFNPTLSGADGNPQLFLPPHWRQPLVPTDTLIAEVNGTAADDVTMCLAVHYNAPAVQGARLLHWTEVDARLANLYSQPISPVPAAATSTWGASEAITTDGDLFKANTDYALLGLTNSLPFTAVAIFGPDTANFPIPVPGSWDSSKGNGWFYEMSKRFDAQLIPVFNSNNKSVTFTKCADVGGGTAPVIDLEFAQLTGSTGGPF